MSKKIIVKVQLPLYSSSKDAGILVYDEEQTIMQELPMRSKKEMLELTKLIGDEMKGYFYAEAELDEKNNLILTDIAPRQDW